MNWIKEKRYRIVVIISAILLLCGFPIILLSQKASGFPNNIWTNVGIFMGMAGGGGIGVVLSFQIMSRRSKKNYNTKQNIPTNRLKQRAKNQFWANCIITIGGLFAFGFMTFADIKGVQGVKYLIFGLIYAAVCVLFMFFLNSRGLQKHTKPEYDEREFSLIVKSINISNNVFIVSVLFAMIVPFYLIGGRGMVPMWSIPLGLYCCVFISGIVQFFVLMRYAKEDDKSNEWGVE